MNAASRKVGRPKSTGEIAEYRQEIRLKPSEFEHLERLRRDTGMPVATYIKKLIEKETGAPDPSKESVAYVPVLGLSYCGDWREAVSDGGHTAIPINDGIGRLLDLHDDDVIVEARGDSMNAAGILDGSYILMSPISPPARPRKYDIVLVQIHRDGECDGMIKRYMGSDSAGRIELEDGEGNTVPIPEDAERVEIVAVARGAITPL